MMNKNKVVLCGKITDPFEIAFVMGGYTYLKTRMTIKGIANTKMLFH